MGPIPVYISSIDLSANVPLGKRCSHTILVLQCARSVPVIVRRKSNSFLSHFDQCGQKQQKAMRRTRWSWFLDIIAEQKRKWKVCHADLGAVCYVQLSAKGLPRGILTPRHSGEYKWKLCAGKRTNVEGSLMYGKKWYPTFDTLVGDF